MRIFLMSLFLLSGLARANYCSCEIYAVSPMRDSRRIEDYTVANLRGKFYGNYDLNAVRDCRNDCAILAQEQYDETTLKDKLLPWADELVAYGLSGYNCTGPTTFKIPVRVRASLGERRLGIARQSVIFLHRERSCFI